MTDNELINAMSLIGDAWPNQKFTGANLELWHRTLRFFDFTSVCETVDRLVLQGQFWRPSVPEFADAYRAQRSKERGNVPAQTVDDVEPALVPSWVRRMVDGKRTYEAAIAEESRCQRISSRS